jgi:hypothetical protein
MTDDISALARLSYDMGVDPIDYAERQIRIHIEVHQTVVASRAVAPETFPGFSPDLSLDALARRILGNLLDAGWKAPEVPQ